MKKFIAILSITVFSLALSINVNAQGPPPPPGGAQSGDNPIGGNAPLGGGLFVLLGMGAAYGGRKLYQLRQEDEKEELN